MSIAEPKLTKNLFNALIRDEKSVFYGGDKFMENPVPL